MKRLRISFAFLPKWWVFGLLIHWGLAPMFEIQVGPFAFFVERR